MAEHTPPAPVDLEEGERLAHTLDGAMAIMKAAVADADRLNGLEHVLCEADLVEAARTLLHTAAESARLAGEVERLTAERDQWKTQAGERFEEYRKARDALYQFNYPPDPRWLRDLAERLDCGSDCEHGHTEYDTNAFVCRKEDSPDGCGSFDAAQLREFAKAIETRAALAPPLVAE